MFIKTTGVIGIAIIISLFSIEALAMSPQSFDKKLDEWASFGPESLNLSDKINSAILSGDTANACKYQKRAIVLIKKGIALGKELISGIDAGALEANKDNKQLRSMLVSATALAELNLVGVESIDTKCQ